MKVVEEYDDARVTHEFEEMTREKRPQDDPEHNGKGLNFQTLEHGGKYPDTMPQALKITERDGRSCTFEPRDKLPPTRARKTRHFGAAGSRFRFSNTAASTTTICRSPYVSPMARGVRASMCPSRLMAVWWTAKGSPSKGCRRKATGGRPGRKHS